MGEHALAAPLVCYATVAVVAAVVVIAVNQEHYDSHRRFSRAHNQLIDTGNVDALAYLSLLMQYPTHALALDAAIVAVLVVQAALAVSQVQMLSAHSAVVCLLVFFIMARGMLDYFLWHVIADGGSTKNGGIKFGASTSNEELDGRVIARRHELVGTLPPDKGADRR
jgi:hypothetical protein